MRLYAHENFLYVFRWVRCATMSASGGRDQILISACGANSAVEATSIPQASRIDRVPMLWQKDQTY